VVVAQAATIEALRVPVANAFTSLRRMTAPKSLIVNPIALSIEPLHDRPDTKTSPRLWLRLPSLTQNSKSNHPRMSLPYRDFVQC
jgi:hypothetical protein